MRSLGLTLTLVCLGRPLAAQTEYVPAYELPGSQMVAVYIGALSCGPCGTPETKAAIRAMKGLVKTQASQQGRSFAAVAVSLDWMVTDGLRFLDSLGTFDEVVLGNNWVNSAAERFIWGDSAGLPTMPQIVVFERTVSTGAVITISAPHVILRIHGADKIQEWVKRGAPIGPAAPTG